MKTPSSSRVVVLGLGAVLAATVLLQAGCNPLECGDGTRELEGQCVPVNAIYNDGGTHCGWGTTLVGTECVPIADLCGDFTKAVPVLDDNGVAVGFTCVGQASGDDPPPPCETSPSGGTICTNGYVHWFVDTEGGIMATRVADPEAAEDATRLVVKVYDPLLYAQNPGVPPLAVAEVNPKNGTFMTPSVLVPGTGFIAFVVEDFEGSGEEIFAFAGIPYAADTTQNLTDVVAPAMTDQQVADWTDAAGGDAALALTGCPAPAGGGERTLATCGTWIGLFSQGVQGAPTTPVEGVTPVYGGALLAENKTLYFGYSTADGVAFDDPEEGVTWSDATGPHDWTGKAGIVFYPGASLGTYGGQCAAGTPCETKGCFFGSDMLGGSAKGAMFVQYVFPMADTCP
jgi:hypothetical protein